MKACIVGAGALGSIFSYHFHKAGLDFVIYEKDRETAEALKDGLSVVSSEGTCRFSPSVSPEPSAASGCSLIFLFVKSYSTENAVKDILPYCSDSTLIVSLQNGLGNYEVIHSFIQARLIVYGTTTIGAAKISPDSVRAGGSGTITIGSPDSGSALLAAEYIKKSGLNVSVTENPELAVWNKAVINAGINPVASIASVKNGAILENSYLMDLQEDVIRESVSVASLLGIKMDADSMLDLTRDVCAKTSGNICSMLQDLEKGRKTEIESINGRIAAYAEELGVKAPVNSTLCTIIKALEVKQNQY